MFVLVTYSPWFSDYLRLRKPNQLVSGKPLFPAKALFSRKPLVSRRRGMSAATYWWACDGFVPCLQREMDRNLCYFEYFFHNTILINLDSTIGTYQSTILYLSDSLVYKQYDLLEKSPFRLILDIYKYSSSCKISWSFCLPLEWCNRCPNSSSSNSSKSCP